MIDLHCHLLPGIDDGAKDLDESLALARLAVQQGITHLVCTPHIQPGRFDNHAGTIEPAFAAFKAGVRAEGLPLHVAAAAEVHFGLEIMDGVNRGTMPYLGSWEGRKVLLLELPHGLVPHGTDRLTRWLINQGVLPMIAHPERNRGFIADPARLRPFFEQGCLMQVTAASLDGRFGESARKLAEALLVDGRVTVIASDAHDTEYRPPLMQLGFTRASELIGEGAALQLVKTNPWTIAAELFEQPVASFETSVEFDR